MEKCAMNTYRAGIDIGSTTVKLVLLDENGKSCSDSTAATVPTPSRRCGYSLPKPGNRSAPAFCR